MSPNPRLGWTRRPHCLALDTLPALPKEAPLPDSVGPVLAFLGWFPTFGSWLCGFGASPECLPVLCCAQSSGREAPTSTLTTPSSVP